MTWTDFFSDLFYEYVNHAKLHFFYENIKTYLN